VTSSAETDAAEALFAGPGEIRSACRSIDWSATALGPVERWPQSLRTAVRICLDASIPMAVWAGPDLTLVYNAGYPPILGPDRHPWALGRPARQVWSDLWDRLAPELERVMRHGEATVHQDERFLLRRGGPPGEASFFTYSFTPIHGDDGHVIAALNVFVETTEHIQAKARTEELLAFALSTAGVGAWEVDLVDHTIHRSEEHDRIFGYEQPLPRWTYELFLEHVFPEDRQEVDRAFQRAVETRTDWSCECRIARRDGETRWIWAAGRHRVEEYGRPSRMAGIVQDTTVRKRAEESLRQSEARYRTLFESIDEGFCIVEVLFEGDRPVDYRFLEVNPAFEQHTGLLDAVGRRMRDLVPEHEGHWFEIYGGVARTGEPVRFQNPANALGRFYDVYAFRVGLPEQRRVAILFNDITESKRAEEALREADRRKDEFLAVLSHELRNPLAPIKNSLHVLDRVDPGGVQARRALAVIGRQADQLSRMVDDLLDVTRITRAKIQLQPGRLELNELVGRTVEDHRSLFEKAHLRLELELAPAPIHVNADRNRLAQVVGNLLQNAVKFTPPDGRVCVSVATDVAAARALLRVADTGAGLAPEIAGRLFQPFVQADTTLDRSKGGLGLGLALVKGLVELHGGEVTASSAGVGRGSEFTVRLPLDLTEPVTAEHERRSPASVRRRVLVIEDNVDAADSLRELLELDGHAVSVAHDGPDGIAKAHAFRPDLVLCDIGLPGMDGYAVAGAFRADGALRDVHLVALSGYALPEDLRRAAEAGFDDHLAKPPSLDILEDLLAGGRHE
jgi:PAS domain S-box-containing protein